MQETEISTEIPVSSRLEQDVEGAIRRAREFFFSVQREEGHWCAELESNTTITSEYVFMCRMLGLNDTLAECGEGITRYLLNQQNRDGSWSIANCWEGDLSTTAEAYLALRFLDLPEDHPALNAAREYILRNGGLEKVRIFTRIFFAMFGLLPWDAIPAIPPEFILVPPKFPVNIYALSSWARGTMVPLFIIFHHRPVYPVELSLDHLWLNPADKAVPYSAPWIRILLKHGLKWKTLFGVADHALKIYERIRNRSIRKLALERCTSWVLERQETSGDWAGIFPPMLNGVIALTLQGYGLDSSPVKRGIDAIHAFAWEDENGYRIQACVSPVWDTALGTIGMIDSKTDPSDPRLERAMRWVLDRQLLVEHGDWKVYRPKLLSGGWSFEYFNSWYPDVDDTAAVLLALLKQDPSRAESEPVRRATVWMLGMQNADGGWAAFDVENDKTFLNEIPFSDMDSLCDPSSPDVTGRVIEAFGLLLEALPAESAAKLKREIRESIRRGIAYLRETQEAQGSWFGRWGVNYVYGTSNVLCGLARTQLHGKDPIVTRAIDWLKDVQNPDGGWGESVASYADKRWMGRGESTASQTAWAVMGLLSFLPPEDPAIRNGIRWLVRHQVPAKPIRALEGGIETPIARGATWDEEQFTGTGFPNHFYLRYHYYRHYFPMMALGRFLRASENE